MDIVRFDDFVDEKMDYIKGETFPEVILYIMFFFIPLGSQLSSLIFGYIRKSNKRNEKYRLKMDEDNNESGDLEISMDE